MFGNANLQGGFYAAPDPSGFRSFSGRYRSKYGQDPVRTATLAYDSVALVAALARTQGGQRFSQEVLTNSSGFAGIDGLFRFRSDGTNERGLAQLCVAATGGGQAVVGVAEELWGLIPIRPEYALGGQIGDYGVEHWKSLHRHPHPSVGIDGDGAFLLQDRDPAWIERSAG